MGLSLVDMQAMVREAQFRPFSGIVYPFGRQTMALGPQHLEVLFTSLGATPASCPQPQADTVTLQSTFLREKPVRDVDFFHLLGFDQVKAIDVSASEGAEIVLDLNGDLPDKLVGTTDLLVDGSTLDNVFDPITALRNAIKLLKPDGRIYLSNSGNYSPIHAGIPYLMFTPAWFYDFFAINNFADCQVVTIDYRPDGAAVHWLEHQYVLRDRKWITPRASEHPTAITVFAERAPHSTWSRTPTQACYRTTNEWDIFEAAVRGFAARGRPWLIQAS